MHKVMRAINDIIEANQVELADKVKLTEIMICELLACKLAIPTSPVEDTKAIFLAQHKANVLRKLYLANEIKVLNIDFCIETIYKLWLIRYKLVHEPHSQTMLRLVQAAVTSNNSHISNGAVEVFNKYPSAFLTTFQIHDLEEDISYV